ncbi:MAG TPA: hypothetical protein VGP23_10705 [Candidatus Binataceae bacterium]|nr:hypothetical protein [Candidatus Binataceae bacterium]
MSLAEIAGARDQSNARATLSIVGASDQLARRAAKFVGDFGAAEHPRDLFDPLGLHQRAHAAAGRAAPFLFFDQEMSVGEGGDLRQMRPNVCKVHLVARPKRVKITSIAQDLD